MIAAIPFGCIRAESISVRGIEFSPEVKSCLDFLGFGHLVEQTIYYYCVIGFFVHELSRVFRKRDIAGAI